MELMDSELSLIHHALEALRPSMPDIDRAINHVQQRVAGAMVNVGNGYPETQREWDSLFAS